MRVESRHRQIAGGAIICLIMSRQENGPPWFCIGINKITYDPYLYFSIFLCERGCVPRRPSDTWHRALRACVPRRPSDTWHRALRAWKWPRSLSPTAELAGSDPLRIPVLGWDGSKADGPLPRVRWRSFPFLPLRSVVSSLPFHAWIPVS